MKKYILFLFVFFFTANVFSQQFIVVRFENDLIFYFHKISGYEFPKLTKGYYEFKTYDSIPYKYFKNKVDSLTLCQDSCEYKWPEVKQQIIIVNGESYDILSLDGFCKIEKNGRVVNFDRDLQHYINVYIDEFKKKNKMPTIEEKLFEFFYQNKKKGH